MRYGVKRPSMPAFTLNNAVDELFKREFDIYRAKKEPHPLMKSAGIDAIPYEHKDLEEWRDAFKRGIKYHHEPTNNFAVALTMCGSRPQVSSSSLTTKRQARKKDLKQRAIYTIHTSNNWKYISGSFVKTAFQFLQRDILFTQTVTQMQKISATHLRLKPF